MTDRSGANCESKAPLRQDYLHLTSSEVHVWTIDLNVSTQTCTRLYTTLSADERARSARFRFAGDQRRYILAHGVLRDLIGRYLQTDPECISYVYNAFGKPDLGPEFDGRIKFSLSHSAGVALVAIIAEAEVGVDVEHTQAQCDYIDIARQFFSPVEVDYLNALTGRYRAEAFFRCWTKKEAYVKALGVGIQSESFSVPLTSDLVRMAVDLDTASGADVRPATCWTLYTLQPAPGYVGALAIQGTRRRLREWSWQPSRLSDCDNLLRWPVPGRQHRPSSQPISARLRRSR